NTLKAGRLETATAAQLVLVSQQRGRDIDSESRRTGVRQQRAGRSTMAIVQCNVQINASPQETMALLSDASRWPDWYPGMTEINIAAPFPEAGSLRTRVRT